MAHTVALRGVVKSYGAFTLGPIDAAFGTGVTALLGANGAGKSTLMRLAVGLLAPERGSVQIGTAPYRESGGEVGYLPQDFVGPAGVRVDEYLAFIAWCRSSRSRRIGRPEIEEALERVDLAPQARARIGSLSGGMVRRLGVAQALLGRATTLVLDEPTVGLDPLQRRELRELLRRLGRDTTVVLSTHLSEDVAAVADEVHVLAGGSTVFTGGVDALCHRGGAVEVSGDAVERGFLTVIMDTVTDVRA